MCSSSYDFETIIIGAGPAGLQLAYLLQREGQSYLVLEAAEEVAPFYRTMPRHRTLLSINKRFNQVQDPEFNLRHDWNSLICDDDEFRFTRFSTSLFPSADELCTYFKAFQDKYQLNIRFNSRVMRISSVERGFLLKLGEKDHLKARYVVIATGAVAPNVPKGIEGIEHACGYEDHSIDLADYENKTVAILGGGNSALEVANHISEVAALIHVYVRHSPRLAWDTHYVGDIRAVNAGIFDMYQLKSLHAVLRKRVLRITPAGLGFNVLSTEDDAHWNVPGSRIQEHYFDKVILCTGWRYFDPELFDDDCRPETSLDGRFPVLSSSWESTLSGVFFVGASMLARDRKSASGFIHGFRHNVESFFHIFRWQSRQASLQLAEFPYANENDLVQFCYYLGRRLTRNVPLFQLHGFLALPVVLEEGRARVFREVPFQWALEAPLFVKADCLVLVTLEFGIEPYPELRSSMDFVAAADATDTRCSYGLHPVLRTYEL